jgi:hypothetical protein
VSLWGAFLRTDGCFSSVETVFPAMGEMVAEMGDGTRKEKEKRLRETRLDERRIALRRRRSRMSRRWLDPGQWGGKGRPVDVEGHRRRAGRGKMRFLPVSFGRGVSATTSKRLVNTLTSPLRREEQQEEEPGRDQREKFERNGRVDVFSTQLRRPNIAYTILPLDAPRGVRGEATHSVIRDRKPARFDDDDKSFLFPHFLTEKSDSDCR